MGKKATIREVAARAGVSPSTVSRVLNGHGADHMRLAPKERVLLAIKELDYVPVKAAQTLRRQHTRVISILLPDISSSFFCTPAESNAGKAWTIGQRRYKMRLAVDDLTGHMSSFLGNSGSLFRKTVLEGTRLWNPSLPVSMSSMHAISYKY